MPCIKIRTTILVKLEKDRAQISFSRQDLPDVQGCSNTWHVLKYSGCPRIKSEPQSRFVHDESVSVCKNRAPPLWNASSSGWRDDTNKHPVSLNRPCLMHIKGLSLFLSLKIFKLCVEAVVFDCGLVSADVLQTQSFLCNQSFNKCPKFSITKLRLPSIMDVLWMR